MRRSIWKKERTSNSHRRGYFVRMGYMQIEWRTVTWYSKLSAFVLFITLPFVGFYFGARYQAIQDRIESALMKVSLRPVASSPTEPESGSDRDLRNATFELDGTAVTLKGGIAQKEAAPGSASKIITRYFGNEAEGDLNFDGVPDTAFLVTQETGGSGTFFYAVVALKTAKGYKTTNAFFVGDRIAPQNLHIVAGELQVNYAERKPGEPMTAQPSVGAVLLLKVTPAGVLEGLMK